MRTTRTNALSMASRSREILDEDRLVAYRGDAQPHAGPRPDGNPRFWSVSTRLERDLHDFSAKIRSVWPGSAPSALPIPSGPRSAQCSGGTWVWRNMDRLILVGW